MRKPWRELARFKEIHKVVLPSVDKEVHKGAEVIEGEEVMTLRPEEQGTQKTLLAFVEDPEGKHGDRPRWRRTG